MSAQAPSRPADASVQRKGRPFLSQEERRVRNLELLQQFGSQVLVPHSPETRIMVRMIYPLNKALSKLRRLVGMPLTVEAVMAAIEPIRMWQADVTRWLKESGGDLILMPTVLRNSGPERKQLAQHRDAHVIVPQTDEARDIIETLVRMDQVLVTLRLVSLETLQHDGRLKEASRFVHTLNETVAKVCQSAQVEYHPPNKLPRIVPKDQVMGANGGAGSTGIGVPAASASVQPVLDR